VEKNATITLYAKGIDQETKDLIYTFFLTEDTISGLEKTATWIAPNTEGVYELMLVAEDEAHQTDTMFLTITVVEEINIFPEIISLTANKKYTSPGGTIHLVAEVVDGNNDPLTYTWNAAIGSISGTGNEIDWNAPLTEGIYTVQLMVSDGRGGIASRSIQLLVIDLSTHIEEDLIAWYPFSGNAQDISGNNLHGQVFGPKLTTDTLGNINSAYLFDGVNDHIKVMNDPILNFTEGITVTLFATPNTMGDKERFIISHGSWQNRWKLSITPDRKVRWTLKTVSGQVRDLDSETILEEDQHYHIGATYNGKFLLLYINGQLESFSGLNGDINASPVDMEIGQILPEDPSYSYSGVLDEVKIYDYALLPDSIAAQSGFDITSNGDPYPIESIGIRIYPNPATSMITIDMRDLEKKITTDKGILTILDTWGREVLTSSVEISPTKTIYFPSMTPGLYILRMTLDGHAFVTKLIIE
ncbi:MAG: LamG-like jellyroll fold domain-containing protein, partial [Saprospiraceae bacterium]